MPFSKISPNPCKGYTYCIMQVVDLFCIFFWKMSFPEGSLMFECGNALSNVVSNIRKASTACFLNLSFIWSPYWSLSAFFNSVVNDFFAWPLWYSPIHSERTDFSQGMQLYSSNFCICWEHACAVRNFPTGQVVWYQRNDHVAQS